MCRMLAKVSVLPTGIMEELEQCPNSLLWLSENGRTSKDPDVRGQHNDGCGMAYIDKNGSLRSTRHGKTDFWNNEYREFATAAQSKIYIAHNRFASEGLELSTKAAHPFIYEKFSKKLAFCHNGSVYSLMEAARAKNTSDSEILLENILEKVNEINVSSLAGSISEIAVTADYNSLTGFLLSSDELYLWRIFNEKRIGEFDKLSRYFTLYLSIRQNDVIIASEPLDNGSWQLLPNYKMLSIKPAEQNIEMRLVDLTH